MTDRGGFVATDVREGEKVVAAAGKDLADVGKVARVAVETDGGVTSDHRDVVSCDEADGKVIVPVAQVGRAGDEVLDEGDGIFIASQILDDIFASEIMLLARSIH